MKNFYPIAIGLGGSIFVFGTIILYTMQFQLLSSLVDRQVFYIQAIITFVLVEISFLVVIFTYFSRYKGVERLRILLSGSTILLALSPLFLVLVNKISVDEVEKRAYVTNVEGASVQRFGLEEGEKPEDDYIDVYLRSEAGKELKLRVYAPFPHIGNKSMVTYVKYTGLTGLQWLSLPN